MEINLSVQNGTLALTSADSVCSEEALEGPSISFQGSRYSINFALSELVYWVRLARWYPASRVMLLNGVRMQYLVS